MARRSIFLICLIIAGPGISAGAPATVDAESYFQQGQLLYAAKNYVAALPALQMAVKLAPMASTYHHMLGKCYGRIAEQGNWLTALRYVYRTKNEFRKAVELDENNIQAWRDLEEFYRKAPRFLGGDRDKARAIRKRLFKLNVGESANEPE